MRSGIRTQDYHFIKTPRDALYYAAEIPRTAWGKPTLSKPNFKLLVADQFNVTPQEQTSWYQKLWDGELFSAPYLIIISSDVDDDMAVSVGYDLMKVALEKHRVQITESARIKEESVNDETVFMLTNVYDEAPQERLQSVRDWCYRHKTCFRIVCAAGSPATLVRRLRLKFNAAFYLDSNVVEEMNFA